MAVIDESTLRERKKARTRQAISDAATDLFEQRGFDAVTIDDVAAAAEVSKKTVFNHFARKEDLLFDEAEAAEARLLARVRGRELGESVLDAVRSHAAASVARMSSGEAPWIERTAPVVAASPALQAREGEIFDHVAHALAEVIREELGARESDARPYLAAQAIVGVQRSVVQSARRRVLAGQRGRGLAASLRMELARGYALLEEGLGGYVRR